MIQYKELSLDVHTRAADTRAVVDAQIELTYGCNLHCVHCYTDCYNRPDLIKRELSYAEVNRILDQLAAEGCLWVCFTGAPAARSSCGRISWTFMPMPSRRAS